MIVLSQSVKTWTSRASFSYFRNSDVKQSTFSKADAFVKKNKGKMSYPLRNEKFEWATLRKEISEEIKLEVRSTEIKLLSTIESLKNDLMQKINERLK